MFLLGTDVVSQRPKPKPDARVMTWLQNTSAFHLCMSVVTIHEVRFGVELLPQGKKRRDIEAWLENELLGAFAERILPIDAKVADVCGRLMAEQRHKRFTANLSDALIAATALVHRLTVVTLNREHFERLGVRLVTL